MITARALGAYVYLQASGASISAETLSRVFPEGRKAFLTALKELREAGLIRTTREVVNGKYVTQSYLVDGSPKKELLIQLTGLNSHLILNAYSLKQERVPGEPRKEEPMSDYYALGRGDAEDLDDQRERARKDRERRIREHQEAKASEAQARIEQKRGKTPIDWTSDDSVYHFAERMANMWHVKPWVTARTRCKGAFATARKTYGTNGEIESRMMDRFFAGIEHNKKIDEPDMIWKLFIRDFASILIDVERSTVTVEDVESAKELAKSQWENF